MGHVGLLIQGTMVWSEWWGLEAEGVASTDRPAHPGVTLTQPHIFPYSSPRLVLGPMEVVDYRGLPGLFQDYLEKC